MLSNAYFLAKFRFDTAENEPAKNLQNFRKMKRFSPEVVGRHFWGWLAPADAKHLAQLESSETLAQRAVAHAVASVHSYVFSISKLERIFSNFLIFFYLLLTFRKQFSEKFNNFRCEISGNFGIYYTI